MSQDRQKIRLAVRSTVTMLSNLSSLLTLRLLVILTDLQDKIPCLHMPNYYIGLAVDIAPSAEDTSIAKIPLPH